MVALGPSDERPWVVFVSANTDKGCLLIRHRGSLSLRLINAVPEHEEVVSPIAVAKRLKLQVGFASFSRLCLRLRDVTVQSRLGDSHELTNFADGVLFFAIELYG